MQELGGMWNKFRDLIGMLVKKQGLSLKQAGKICVFNDYLSDNRNNLIFL